MVDAQRAAVCVRAREWACQRLDGELSEFEALLLQAHVGRCEACREFAHEVAAITHHLRHTSAEQLVRPFTLPPRRRLIHSNTLLAAVAAAAVALSATGLASMLGTGGVSRGLPPTIAETTPDQSPAGSEKDLGPLRALRVAQLRPSAVLAAARPPRRRGPQIG